MAYLNILLNLLALGCRAIKTELIEELTKYLEKNTQTSITPEAQARIDI